MLWSSSASSRLFECPKWHHYYPQPFLLRALPRRAPVRHSFHYDAHNYYPLSCALFRGGGPKATGITQHRLFEAPCRFLFLFKRAATTWSCHKHYEVVVEPEWSALEREKFSWVESCSDYRRWVRVSFFICAEKDWNRNLSNYWIHNVSLKFKIYDNWKHCPLPVMNGRSSIERNRRMF